jgi:hypothetical protein
MAAHYHSLIKIFACFKHALSPQPLYLVSSPQPGKVSQPNDHLLDTAALYSHSHPHPHLGLPGMLAADCFARQRAHHVTPLVLLLAPTLIFQCSDPTRPLHHRYQHADLPPRGVQGRLEASGGGTGLQQVWCRRADPAVRSCDRLRLRDLCRIGACRDDIR